MFRRVFYIGLVLLARLVTFARLNAEEPTPLPMPTLGGKQFWADELFFHDWRIQRNVSNEQYRLLDGKDFRYASGTFEQCRAALEAIKQRKKLPPMSGKAVVVLHGLIRSRASMDSLCRYLHEKGGYTIFNVEYPSTQADIAEHARCLRKILENLTGIEEINFIGHSMGNIVIRHCLGDFARQDPMKQPPNEAAADRRALRHFHRFVMLAPPNQGAELAVTFADNVLFKSFAGDAGQQLGRDWPELEKRLATPDFEFGIIAGGKANGKGYNPLLPGDNDGTITVASTRLPGARDSVVVPVLHSFIMDNAKAKELTLRFLQTGRFTDADNAK
jgi:hypothetical protein